MRVMEVKQVNIAVVGTNMRIAYYEITKIEIEILMVVEVDSVQVMVHMAQGSIS